MRPLTLLASFAFAWLALSSVALACSDAGPGNTCNPGGPEWIGCSSHAECPSGQVCGSRNSCVCGSCPYGDVCEGDSCQCAAQPEPSPEDGCVVVRDSCGSFVQDCNVDAGPPAGGSAGGSGGGACNAAPAGRGSSFFSVLGLGVLGLIWRRRATA